MAACRRDPRPQSSTADLLDRRELLKNGAAIGCGLLALKSGNTVEATRTLDDFTEMCVEEAVAAVNTLRRNYR